MLKVEPAALADFDAISPIRRVFTLSSRIELPSNDRLSSWLCPPKRRCPLARLICVLLHPFPSGLVEIGAVVLEVVRDGWLYCIIRLRRSQNCPHQLENLCDLVRGLPLVWLEHSQAHAALLIVGDIRVVDLRAEGEHRRLEGVLFRESDLDVELAALRIQTNIWSAFGPETRHCNKRANLPSKWSPLDPPALRPTHLCCLLED